MRNRTPWLALSLLGASAIAAFGGYQVGKAEARLESPPANAGLVKALSSVGVNLLGAEGFHAHIGADPVLGESPDDSVPPDPGIVSIELNESALIRVFVNVVRPEVRDNVDSGRYVYRLEVGDGSFTAVSDTRADPPATREEDIGEYTPCVFEHR